MSEKQTFEAGKEPLIEIISISGDLVIKPWMQLDVQARGNFTAAEKKAGVLQFEAEGDLVLAVPVGASVGVDQVAGDAVISSITGSCTVGEAHGDVVLKNLVSATVGAVHGDLVARNLSGPLQVDALQGDAVFRSIDGDVTIGECQGDITVQHGNGHCLIEVAHGDINLAAVNGDVTIGEGRRDLNLREINGLVRAANITGDIRLRGGLPLGEHTLVANKGDIVVRWPRTQALEVTVAAPEVRNQLPLEDVVEDKGGFHGRIGSGGPHLILQAGRRVSLKEGRVVDEKWEAGEGAPFDFSFMNDLSELGTRISSEVNASVNKLAAEMEANLGTSFEHLGEQLARKANAAAEKARVMAEEMAEKEASRAPKPPPAPEPPPKREPVSNTEEQLRILKMVEKGVITPEEANLLLEALEGN